MAALSSMLIAFTRTYLIVAHTLHGVKARTEARETDQAEKLWEIFLGKHRGAGDGVGLLGGRLTVKGA